MISSESSIKSTMTTSPHDRHDHHLLLINYQIPISAKATSYIRSSPPLVLALYIIPADANAAVDHKRRIPQNPIDYHHGKKYSSRRGGLAMHSLVSRMRRTNWKSSSYNKNVCEWWGEGRTNPWYHQHQHWPKSENDLSFVVVRDDKVENEVYVGATVVVTVVVILIRRKRHSSRRVVVGKETSSCCARWWSEWW